VSLFLNRRRKFRAGELWSSDCCPCTAAKTALRWRVRGILIYCSDYKCSRSIAISADQWPDDVRLSDLGPRFVCKSCGKRGADVRPDFNWNKRPVAMMGYR